MQNHSYFIPITTILKNMPDMSTYTQHQQLQQAFMYVGDIYLHTLYHLKNQVTIKPKKASTTPHEVQKNSKQEHIAYLVQHIETYTDTYTDTKLLYYYLDTMADICFTCCQFMNHIANTKQLKEHIMHIIYENYTYAPRKYPDIVRTDASSIIDDLINSVQ